MYFVTASGDSSCLSSVQEQEGIICLDGWSVDSYSGSGVLHYHSSSHGVCIVHGSVSRRGGVRAYRGDGCSNHEWLFGWGGGAEVGYGVIGDICASEGWYGSILDAWWIGCGGACDEEWFGICSLLSLQGSACCFGISYCAGCCSPTGRCGNVTVGDERAFKAHRCEWARCSCFGQSGSDTWSV